MARKQGKATIYLQYLAVRVVFLLLSSFPLKVSMGIGKGFALLMMKTLKRLRKTAFRNLEIAFPEMSEAERSRLVRGTFESIGRHLGFVSHLPRMTAAEVHKNIEIVNPERIIDAYATGRGLVIFTAHFGSWELVHHLAGMHGYQLDIIVRPIDNPMIEGFVNRFRTKFGNQTIYKAKAARTAIKLLLKKHAVGILTDLNSQPPDGIFVPFFGVEAATSSAAARLALSTDSLLLPVFMVWDEDKGKYVAYFESWIESERSGNDEAEVRRLTEQITSLTEAYVRRFPEQWLWIHKRWNTRPEGEPGLY
jgi:KDO2-lipid IV(A) lauroyltransferase